MICLYLLAYCSYAAGFISRPWLCFIKRAGFIGSQSECPPQSGHTKGGLPACWYEPILTAKGLFTSFSHWGARLWGGRESEVLPTALHITAFRKELLEHEALYIYWEHQARRVLDILFTLEPVNTQPSDIVSMAAYHNLHTDIASLCHK